MSQFPTKLTKQFENAVAFAIAKHGDQVRKNSAILYVSHPLRVAGNVMEYGADEETVIGALFHDIVEDCGGMAAAEEINAQFGANVYRYVLECSDSALEKGAEKEAWEIRKKRSVAHLSEITPQSRLIVACDKIDNMNSTLRVYPRIGKEVWTRFKTGREGQIWYMSETLKGLRAEHCPACNEFEMIFDLLKKCE